MAEQDLKQVMLDAILDADSLEQFINGSDSETVLTRLSAEYPTLRNALKQMFESGGLPATPFKTKADMQSSDLIDGNYAIVTEDGRNNGLYLKNGASWVFSEYQVGLGEGYLREDDIFTKSENLYNNDYYIGFVVSSTGWVHYWTKYGAENTFVVFIELEPLADYTVTKFQGGDFLRLATLNSLPDRNDTSFNVEGIYTHISEGSDEKTHSFTNTDSAKYLAVSVTTTNTPPNDVKVAVTKTASAVPYTPYKGDELNSRLSNSVKSKARSVIFEGGLNLYPNKPIENVVILGSTLDISYHPTPSAKTGFISVDKNKTYTVTLHDGGDYLRAAFVDSLPPSDIALTDIKPFYTASKNKDVDGKASVTITNTWGAKYLAINANSNIGDGVVPSVTVVEGFVAPSEFIPYSAKLTLELESAVRSIDGLDLFNPVDISSRSVDRFERMAFNSAGTLISTQSLDNSSVVYRVPVSYGDVVHIDRYKNGIKTGNRFGISESYKANKLTADADGIYQNITPIVDNYYLPTDNSIDSYTYVVKDSNVKELWVYASYFNTDPKAEYSFEFGTIIREPKSDSVILASGLTEDGSDAYIKSDGHSITGDEIVDGIQGSTSNFLTYRDINNYYPQYLLNTVPLSELYARYDALVEDYPDYVSKEVLWTDEDGVEMRLYKFIPRQVRATGIDGYRNKRVLLVSGVHGDEKAATIGDSHFLESIARYWSGNNVLSYLRHRVEFYVIPVVNTTGYVDNSRFNRSGVNINREFDLSDGRDWSERTPEAMIVNDVLQAREYDVCIDHHTDAVRPPSKTSYSWIISGDTHAVDEYVETMEDLRAYWSLIHELNNKYTHDTELYHILSQYTAGTLGEHMGKNSGIGLTLETMNDYYTNTGGLSNEYWTQSITTEIVSNFVYRLVKQSKG